MERRAFEDLIQEAMQELPREFQEKLTNVAIIVEDYPSQETVTRLNLLPDETLCGLYEGVPLTERGFAEPLYPDRIFLFQRAIEDECESREEIKEEIKVTLVHEIAHFFGIDDDRLHALGAY